MGALLQWSPPCNGGSTTELVTGAGELDKPQWSPPMIDGTMGVNCCNYAQNVIAAMETHPILDHGHLQRAAAIEPAVTGGTTWIGDMGPNTPSVPE
jgi:hypothetical protein